MPTLVPPFTVVPSRSRPDAFAVEGDTCLSEWNARIAAGNTQSEETNANAIAVEAAKVQAEAAAAAVAASYPADLWVSGTNYVVNDKVYSPANGFIYKRLSNGAGVTDPRDDAANWTLNTIPYTNVQTFKGFNEAATALGANDINLSLGGYFSKTITVDTTFTVSNVPATGLGVAFILELTNAGAKTITWWANMKWAGGSAPSLTTAGRDSLGFYTHDAGATWTGLLLGRDIR